MKKRNFADRIFARVKKSNDVIIPYDGDDAVYAVGDIADDAEITFDVTEEDSAYRKSFIDIVKSKLTTKKPEPPQDIYDDSELDSEAEAAFDYFRGISRKIESLKKSVSQRSKDTDAAYIREVTARLEEINTMLDGHMSAIASSADGISEAAGKYDELTRGIESVTRTTEENVGKISELSSVVTTVSQRVDEIHTTTNSFDKLYDAVFEFKTAISEMKQNMASVDARQKKLTKIVCWLMSISIAFGIGSLAVAIVALVL